MKKKIIVAFVIVIAGILIWRIITLFSGDDGESALPERPPVAVEVDSVRYGSISEVRMLTGTVFPKYQYIVAPKVSGRIITIKKRIGDWVRAGEVIAHIDDAEYQQGVLEAQANIKIAEASLAEARSQFELARQEKERAELLQAKGIASQAELDAAVSNYSAQESRLQLMHAQVEQRTASLKSAKIRLSYTRLTASQPGLIGERFVDEGALLVPNSAVVSIIAIDSIIVRTTIIERDYGRIKNGQSAKVTVDAFPSRYFSGTVMRIAPMLQENSRVAQMEVEVANDQFLLKPGMFARVDVVIAEAESTQIVPSTALVNRSGQTGIFMVAAGEDMVHYFQVDTGIITPERTEILSPSLTGVVVTLGQHLLDDGSPVLLPKTSTEQPPMPDTSAGKENRP
ncbi:MAG: efflux RND transporter periplasmic adaptor subunit [Candidatus Latescibacterota bacterium]